MFRSLRISHVKFPGSEKLGPSRNGRIERNFPVIPIFRNFRPSSRGTSKISEWNSGKGLFHSLPNPEFAEFLVEWKAPTMFSISRSFSSFCSNSQLFQDFRRLRKTDKDFRRLPKISEDHPRFPRRNPNYFLSSLYSHGKEIIFAVYTDSNSF